MYFLTVMELLRIYCNDDTSESIKHIELNVDEYFERQFGCAWFHENKLTLSIESWKSLALCSLLCEADHFNVKWDTRDWQCHGHSWPGVQDSKTSCEWEGLLFPTSITAVIQLCVACMLNDIFRLPWGTIVGKKNTLSCSFCIWYLWYGKAVFQSVSWSSLIFMTQRPDDWLGSLWLTGEKVMASLTYP